MEPNEFPLFKSIITATVVSTSSSSAPFLPSMFPHLSDYDVRTISQYESHHAAETSKNYRPALEGLKSSGTVLAQAKDREEDLVKVIVVVLQRNCSMFLAGLDQGTNSFEEILEDKKTINEFVMKMVLSGAGAMMEYDKAIMTILLDFMHLIHKKLALAPAKFPASIANFLALHYTGLAEICFSRHKDLSAISHCGASISEFLQAALNSFLHSVYTVPISGCEKWVRRDNGFRAVAEICGRKKFGLILSGTADPPMFSLLHVALSTLRGLIQMNSGLDSKKLFSLLLNMMNITRKTENSAENSIGIRMNESVLLLKTLQTLFTTRSPEVLPQLEIAETAVKDFITQHLSFTAENHGFADFLKEPFKLISRLRAVHSGKAKLLAYEVWRLALGIAGNSKIKAGSLLVLKTHLVGFIISGDGEELGGSIECAMEIMRSSVCGFVASKTWPLAGIILASEEGKDRELNDKLIEWISKTVGQRKDWAKKVLEVWIKECKAAFESPAKLFGLYRLIYSLLLNHCVNEAAFHDLLFHPSPPQSKPKVQPADVSISAFVETAGLDIFSGLTPQPSLVLTLNFFVNGICEFDELCREVTTHPKQILQTLDSLVRNCNETLGRFLHQLLGCARGQVADKAYVPHVLLEFADKCEDEGAVVCALRELGSFAEEMYGEAGHQALLAKGVRIFFGIVQKLVS